MGTEVGQTHRFLPPSQQPALMLCIQVWLLMCRAQSGKEFPGEVLQSRRVSHAFLVLPVSVSGQK